MGDNAAQTISHLPALNRAHALLYKTSYREVACKNHNLETLNQFIILEQSEFGENRVGEGGKRSPTDEVIKRSCSTYIFIFFLIYVFIVKQRGCTIRLWSNAVIIKASKSVSQYQKMLQWINSLVYQLFKLKIIHSLRVLVVPRPPPTTAKEEKGWKKINSSPKVATSTQQVAKSQKLTCAVIPGEAVKTGGNHWKPPRTTQNHPTAGIQKFKYQFVLPEKQIVSFSSGQILVPPAPDFPSR